MDDFPPPENSVPRPAVAVPWVDALPNQADALPNQADETLLLDWWYLPMGDGNRWGDEPRRLAD